MYSKTMANKSKTIQIYKTDPEWAVNTIQTLFLIEMDLTPTHPPMLPPEFWKQSKTSKRSKFGQVFFLKHFPDWSCFLFSFFIKLVKN